MLTLDGEAGGGQLVRTAVAMSVVKDVPIEMQNVRGARDDPGLRPQHVAAIETVAAISDASTENVAIGSTDFSFTPGDVSGGRYEVAIGTAGSITLVFDALLPLALVVPEQVTVAVTGGTDVRWSPPIDYFRSVKVPTLDRFGVNATTSVDRRGFYPSGGGRAELTIWPSSLEPIRLDERGTLQSIAIDSVASKSLADASVADRQADRAAALLGQNTDVPIERMVSYADVTDKGSVIHLTATYESAIAGFSSLGEPGKPSEAVAESAVDAFGQFQASTAAVDDHLADQLVPFLGLGGGRIRIPELTSHVETTIDLMRSFGCGIDVEDGGDGVVTLASDGVERYGATP